jgi:hypothetical protein
MRLRPVGGLDLTTGTLLLGGAALLALSLVGAFVLLAPPAAKPTPPPEPVAESRAADALTADHVVAVLTVDGSSGAATAVQAGDRVDVLGYFSKQLTGTVGFTRVMVHDVPVLTSERSGTNVALSLALPRDAAMLLHEAQALGARPFVTLRAVGSAVDAEPAQATFSDSDLAIRMAGGQ